MNQDNENKIAGLVEKNKHLQRTIEELSILNDIASAISTSQSLEEIESLIIKKCIKHLSVEEGVVMLLDDSDVDRPFQTILRSHNSLMDSLPFKLDAQLMGWIIKNKTSITVNNFAEDDRFYKRQDQNVALKSLIAVPMFIKSRLIGIIVLFNKLTGDFTNDDQRLLSICASQSAQVIERARLYRQEYLLAKLKEEMNLAAVIQKNLLPKEEFNIEGYTITGISLPAKEVGGDFFDYIPLSEDKLALWLGDVTGKGITAALIMAHLQGVLRSRSIINKDCRLCVEYTNKAMINQGDDGKFATLFYSILDVKTNQLKFISAGDNELVHLKHTGEVETYTTTDVPIGIYPSYEFAEKTLTIESGDILVIYSDGLTEVENLSSQQLGKKRFLELIRSASKLPPEEFFEDIFEKLKEFSNNQPRWDDQTMLFIKLD